MGPTGKVVDFKTSGYFSGFFIFIGVIFVFVALIEIGRNLAVTGVLGFLSLIIFTTHYRLRIDLEKKEYHDYLWILGLRNGERGKFEFLDCLLVKKSHVSQKMQLRAASSTVRKDVYDGYLKLSGTTKIHLITADDKDTVVKFLKSASTTLNVKVYDLADGEPVEL